MSLPAQCVLHFVGPLPACRARSCTMRREMVASSSPPAGAIEPDIGTDIAFPPRAFACDIATWYTMLSTAMDQTAPRKMRQTTLRFSEDLWSSLEAEAGRRGVSAAQYVRDAVLERLS